ncbi:RNA pseudouridylate synthase domain-containing protein 2 [Geodia barretti]|uniref:Pseudouridylate synthase RPUSD2 n=1 Tax=Geodia barretti TaxID=519541 RepID=A0AA35SPF1_GEOBA|nr:RNA pseudouridylate synthase domain-containing protein 2 [Geodia barretti]
MSKATKRPGEDALQEAEPRRKKGRKHRPGFDDEIFAETSYEIRNGLRHVKPYYFSFTSHTKGRWVGSSVYEVFCREFQAEKPEYYEKAIRSGKVTVNDKRATMETVLHHNDLMVHRVHRHEPPVSADPLTILHLDSDILAINKPHSIPVHPCGRYRHNSVVFLLGKEHSLRNLHTIHRLDRLTSGLLLFARNLTTAQRMEQQIRERQVSKEYICKVHGKFPDEPVLCTEPIVIVTHKLGICRVDPAGKTCLTSFTRLSYDIHKDTSILKCEPKTGRMHQIRVHLQWLGHPIVNDPLYCHPAWGPHRGRDGLGIRDMDQVISDIVKSNYNSQEAAVEATPTATPYKTVHSVTPAPAIAKDEEKLPEKGEEREDTVEKTEFEDGLTSSGSDGSVPDPDCTECGLVHPDPTPDQLMMYLHALRYAGLDWEYCADMPSWAKSGDKSLTDSGENDQKPLEKSNDKSLEKVAENQAKSGEKEQAKSGEKERAKSGEKEQAKSGETSKKTII